MAHLSGDYTKLDGSARRLPVGHYRENDKPDLVAGIVWSVLFVVLATVWGMIGWAINIAG